MEAEIEILEKWKVELKYLEKWKTEIATMEEALKKDIDSSLNDISTWNKANQVYLHVNIEVAEQFTNTNSPRLVEVKMKKERINRKIKGKVIEEDFTMNNPVHTPVGKLISPLVPEQGCNP